MPDTQQEVYLRKCMIAADASRGFSACEATLIGKSESFHFGSSHRRPRARRNDLSSCRPCVGR